MGRSKNSFYRVFGIHFKGIQKVLGITETLFILAADEGFTYITTIQEYNMVMKAIERGVYDEAILRTLNIDIKILCQKMAMLKLIIRKVSEKLANKPVGKEIFRILRKMKLERQIEASDMMLLSSRKEELIESHRLKATSELADVAIM